jgi:hypothetical protein
MLVNSITLCFVAFAVLANPNRLNMEKAGEQTPTSIKNAEPDNLQSPLPSNVASQMDDIAERIANLKRFMFDPKLQNSSEESYKMIKELRVAISNLESQADKISNAKTRSARKVQFALTLPSETDEISARL